MLLQSEQILGTVWNLFAVLVHSEPGRWFDNAVDALGRVKLQSGDQRSTHLIHQVHFTR